MLKGLRVVAVIACSLFMGCGRLGFDAQGNDAGETDPADAAPIDAGIIDAPSTDLDASAAQLSLQATCSTGGISILTIPEGASLAVGSHVLLRVLIRDRGLIPPSAVDSAGNSYSLDVSALATDNGTKTHIYVLSAILTSELGAGDSVTVTHEDELATGVALDLVHFGERVASTTATAESTMPAGTITTDGPGAVLVVTGMSNHTTIQLPVEWTPLPAIETACGGTPGIADGYAALLSIDSAQEVSFLATIEQARIWSLGLVHYAP